jgi:hypothetical protein
MPYYTSTFYAFPTSSVSAPWIPALLFVLASWFPLLSGPIIIAQGCMKGQHLFMLVFCFFFDLPRFCFLFFSYFLFFLILYFLFFSSYFLFYSLLFSPLPVIIGDFSPSIYSYHLLSVPFYALSFSTYSPFLSFFFGLFCVILFFSCSI